LSEYNEEPSTHDQRILMAIYGELCKISNQLAEIRKSTQAPKEPKERKPRKPRKTATKKEG
jgi:hypothetical protein